MSHLTEYRYYRSKGFTEAEATHQVIYNAVSDLIRASREGGRRLPDYEHMFVVACEAGRLLTTNGAEIHRAILDAQRDDYERVMDI